MREIKFRAWDKKNNRMEDGEGWHEFMGLKFDGKVVGIGEDFDTNYDDDIFSWVTTEDLSDRIILMQYTGLKDKNGVEIYEGDVVAYKDFLTEETAHAEVIWYSGTMDMNAGEYAYIQTGFAAQLLTHKNTYEDENIKGIAEKYDFTNYGGNGDLCADKVEVIGNIYENPELVGEDRAKIRERIAKVREKMATKTKG